MSQYIINQIDGATVPNAPAGKYTLFLDLDGIWKKKDDSGNISNVDNYAELKALIDALQIQVDSIQDKTDFITISQPVNLDTLEADVNQSKIDIENIEVKTDLITVTLPIDLDSLQNVVADLDQLELDVANIEVKTDLITVTQPIDLDTLDNVVTDISQLQTDVNNIELKTDFITVTQNVDLDDVEDKALNAVPNSEKGVAGGVATLDGSGTVPISQIPSSIIGGINVIGSWDANANIPDLSSLTLNQGEAYIVSVDGNTNLNGETNWRAKDLATWDDSLTGNWFKLDNTDDVLSVNGQTGVVVLSTDDVDDSFSFANKYVTPSEKNQISVNEGAIGVNSTNISTNTSDISTNASNISNNATDISTNTTAIALNTAKVSADGSVSTHNDVDTVTNPPIASKSYLRFDGTNWIPHINYYDNIESALSRVSQTTIGLINQSTTLEEYLRLEMTPTDTDNYKFMGSFVYSYNSTTNDFVAVVEVRTITGNVLIKEIATTMEEQKDSGSAGINLNVLSGGVVVGNTNTGTNQMRLLAFNQDVELNQGTDYYCAIKWRGEQANNEAAIYKANISVEQKTKSI